MKPSKLKRRAKRKFISVPIYRHMHGIYKLSKAYIENKRISRNKRRNLKEKLCHT